MAWTNVYLPLPLANMSTQPIVLASEIERETGFGKDQLRKWRQRFGFPPAESTANSKAAYSRETVDQLLLIKRLLEGGFRPRQVVGKTALELAIESAALHSADSLTTDEVVARAESYFLFLMEDA